MPGLFLDLQISPQGRNHTGYVTHKSELPAGTVTEIPAEVLKWLPAQIRGYVFPHVYQASKFLLIYVPTCLLPQGSNCWLG